MKKNYVYTIKDLFYYLSDFKFEGQILDVIYYYRLTNVVKDESGEVIEVDVEVVFEPSQYLSGGKYSSKKFTVLKKDFDFQIKGAIQLLTNGR